MDFRVMYDYVIDFLFSKTRYEVVVRGTKIHNSRSYRKADATYEAEVAFAKMFSSPTSITLSKIENGKSEYIKVALVNKVRS